MRTLALLLSPAAFLLQFSQIEVREVRTTPTQAVLQFAVPQLSGCRLRVAYDAGFTRIVHDTNTSLFSGSQDCDRAGSVVNGSNVTFVVGLRRAAKAADGKFYSRALEAYTPFHYEITSAGQTFVGSFHTKTPPLGNIYGEAYPFDSEAPGNYAWPTVDWSDLTKEYVDPLTGVMVKRFSGPGMITPVLSPSTAALAAFDTASDWTSPENGAAIDGAVAEVASSQAPLFVQVPQMCINPFVCGVGPGWQFPGYSVDNMQVSLKAWCSTANCLSNTGGARDVDLCITVDGVRCSTAWKTVTVGTSSSAAQTAYPQNLGYTLFSEWLGGSFIAPPARPYLSSVQGKVNTAGETVTLASGDRFPMDAWTAGSRISIGGTVYLIASVDSPASLTLQSSAGNQNDVAYTGNNIGVLIRKSSSGPDALNVDGVNFRWATSAEMEMGASGFHDSCSPQQVTDYQGVSGFVCSFRSPVGYPGMWFVSSKGTVRFLGTPEYPFNLDVSGGAIDGNNGGDCVNGFSLSSSNPNQFFCVVPSNANGIGSLIFRGTYHSEGRAGCAEAAGYVGIAGGKSCLITWENLTKASQGRAMDQQIQSVPGYHPGLYGQPRMFGGMGRHLGFYAWLGQDDLAYSFWFDDNGTMVSAQEYHTQLPCRWCTVHSFFEAGSPDTGNGGWNAVVVKDTVGGHHETPVLGVDGSVNGAMSRTLLETCPADLPQQYQDQGATGNRCITITVTGEPCRLSASSAELAHMPACPWQAGGVNVQPMQPGDEAYGVSNGVQTTERFLIVKSLGNNRWVLMRNHNVQHGSLLNQGSSVIADHAAGWKLRMACAAATGSGYTWVKFTDPSEPKFRDNSLSPAQHGDVSALGTLMADYCGDIDRYCLPIWQQAIPERIGANAERRKLGGWTFNRTDVWQYEVYRQFIQTHPSWRQVTAPENERGWFLDGNPWAAQAGGVYTLWNQQVSHISGSLFRLNSVAHTPMVRKTLATVAWAGGYLLEDISGPGSVLADDSQGYWKYCVADNAGECVPGSAAGSVYINVPSLTADGKCGDSFYYRRPCFTSNVNPGIGINQVGTRDYDAYNFGERFLTAHLQRYNYTWTYSNAAPTPDGKFAVVPGSWLGGVRNELLLMKIPPFPDVDSVDRSNFVPVAITAGAAEGAASVRVRFGYAENGPSDSYFCTSRKEACVTGGNPYSWLSQSAAPQSCGSGTCRVNIPAISGRVVYYIVDRLDSSGDVVDSSARGAIAVP